MVRRRNSILSLEKVLGFGSVEHNSFNYCGKRISQDLTSGVVTVTMKEYHENVRPAVVPLHRRADPNALLTSSEQKQLRALLGSLQWLVAQARIDQGFGALYKENNLRQLAPCFVATCS